MRFSPKWILGLVLLFGGSLLGREWFVRHIISSKVGEPSRNLSSPPSQTLLHGEQQLLQMMRDRPAMQNYIRPPDPIWNWCVRQFAGEATGEPVEWHSEPPEGKGIDCDSLYASKGKGGFIRIRQRDFYGTARPGERYWADAIYELNNLSNSKQFRASDKAAWEGKISKEKWVRQTLQLEYQTMQRTRHIYTTLWKPLMDKRGIASKPYIYRWGVTLPKTFEEWLVELTEGDNPSEDNAVEYYGKLYDAKFAAHVTALKSR